MISAIGMVQNTVKVPQGLPISALTTTSASTASTMTQISSMPMPAIAAGDGSHLGADHVAERAAVASRGQEQHGHVLHGAGEHDPREDPERAGQITHLRGQHRADQRSGAGDGGEMVAEQHVAVGRHVVEPVIVAIGRRLPRRVDAEHLVGDEQRVEAVGDEVDADRRDDQPGGVDRIRRA